MKSFVLFYLLIFCLHSNGQPLKTYSFQEVEKLVKENPRPILLYFYTDWCTYCKLMQNTTFKNKKVVEKLNAHYYVIIFNAEEKKDILHLNKTFRFNPNGYKIGTHEIVNYYLENYSKTYPTILILNADFNHQLIIQKYISSNDFIKII